MWESPLSSWFWVRAKDSVFQQLTAEENLTKEVEITGILRNMGTLDIATVTISGSGRRKRVGTAHPAFLFS